MVGKLTMGKECVKGTVYGPFLAKSEVSETRRTSDLGPQRRDSELAYACRLCHARSIDNTELSCITRDLDKA